ncbi:MAG: hypothetical protein ACE3JP_03970 [Ectobacillus sp.]
MKKLVAGILGVSLVLAGCGYADGVDTQFGDKAVSIFAEIDDDTMALELSDRNDISNFELLGVEADTKQEVKFMNGLEGMVKLQDKVVNGDREALKEYMFARKSALNALGVKDNGAVVPQFSFYEEE